MAKVKVLPTILSAAIPNPESSSVLCNEQNVCAFTYIY